MKKKYINSILVIILVVIWGSIIKKYFGKTEANNNVVELNAPMSNYAYDNATSKDTFLLELVNTNPFKASLRKKKRKGVVLNRNASNKITVKKKIDKSMVWPKMSYHGFVKSSDKNTKMVLLKVNDRLYRKREKEKINELLIVKAYKDSLILSNNNNLKTIFRIHETL